MSLGKITEIIGQEALNAFRQERFEPGDEKLVKYIAVIERIENLIIEIQNNLPEFKVDEVTDEFLEKFFALQVVSSQNSENSVLRLINNPISKIVDYVLNYTTSGKAAEITLEDRDHRDDSIQKVRRMVEDELVFVRGIRSAFQIYDVNAGCVD